MSNLSRAALSFLLLFLSAAWLSPVLAQKAVIPGEVSTPFPTLTNLAVEWMIQGDDNLNGKVEVDYRMAGETAWQKAMPLVRVPEGNSGEGTKPTYRWPNKFSGSIFDLKPGTGYEIRLRLSDPDGGKEERIVSASTRPVPRPAADATVRKVNPVTFRDSLFTAMPGDILLLSPGYYEENVIPLDGAPGRPIVIRADRSHPVIGSTFDGLSLEGRKHVIVEGLTVTGTIDIRGAEDVAVRYCQVEAPFGIVAKRQPGAKNCYIADNTVSYRIPWVREGIGSGSVWGGAANIGEGIEITGPGNVICHNKVSGFRDCISTMEDLWVFDQFCIDIYNNEISVGPDDGIEADFSMHNCRIYRNRISNCGMGVSSQPTLGGPAYYMYNVMYNIAMCPFKVCRGSTGALFYHNTSVKVGDGFYEHHGQGSYFRAVFVNNLALGGEGGGPTGRYSTGEQGLAVSLPGFNPTCVFDYNAVGTVGTPFGGLVGERTFDDIAGLRSLTGGKNSVRIELNSFAAPVEFPHPIFDSVRKPADLRLSPASPAVDAGMVLPNLNDGFSGKAPDIGAYEQGRDLPHYGPRAAGEDEETDWLERHARK